MRLSGMAKKDTSDQTVTAECEAGGEGQGTCRQEGVHPRAAGTGLGALQRR